MPTIISAKVKNRMKNVSAGRESVLYDESKSLRRMARECQSQERGVILIDPSNDVHLSEKSALSK